MAKVRNAAALAVGLLCGSLLAGDGTASNRTFVQLRPVQNSFWHTATNATLTLPVTYPHGATKASLAVRGVGYSRDYADITGDEFTLNLPPAAGPADENVYRLTLTFETASSRRPRSDSFAGMRRDRVPRRAVSSRDMSGSGTKSSVAASCRFRSAQRRSR